MDLSRQESTQPRIFHIHLDARQMPPELDEYAIRELGFTATDFEGHPEGFDHFEPNRHLTLKVRTKEEFRKAWESVSKKAAECSDFVGYLEGEFIPTDEYLPFHPYRDVPIPFRVVRRKLDPKNEEDFRQTELHLTLERRSSHPDLIEKLLRSGLYGAYLPKADGEFLVLTMQGYLKDISPLIVSLRRFILDSGGAYRCTLKEERAIAHILRGISPTDLPEIADEVEYYGATVTS